MNNALLLDRAATASPERPAIYLGQQPLRSYRELRDRVAALAGALTSLGCGVGDRVAVVMDNRPEYLEVLFAAWWAGLAVVPVNAKLHPGEVAWILQDSGARVVVTDRAHVAGLRGVLEGDLAETRPLVADSAHYDALVSVATGTVRPCANARVTDLAWLFYTSGTTGRPKGVMLGHRQLLAMTLSYHAQVDAVGADDRTVYAAPMSHGAGLYSTVFMLHGSGHVFPPSGRFDAAEICDIAIALGNVSLFAAPTIVNRLAAHLTQPGARVKGTASFRTIVYGGGPMYVDDLIRAREAMGDCFVQIYGQGESPMTITTLSRDTIADDQDPRWQSRIASVGTAFAICDVAVVDASGEPVPPGVTGEVVVRGDTVMMGYWRNEDATASTIRDGWLSTGDMGSLDHEGYLTLKDRSKDVIISGGTNIYPREVEEVLLRHAAVTEVSVIGRADPEWGESVIACVVVDDTSVGAHELDEFCRQHVAGFKRPKQYHFLQALPKNSNGKVLKTHLRTAYAAPTPYTGGGCPAAGTIRGPDMTTQQPVSIIGGYQSDFARNFTKESLEISDLVKETTTGTLTAAGISTAQVEVVHVANAMGEFYVKQGHLGSMVASVVPDLSGVPATRHEAACASGSVAVMAAMADLESGRYDVALVLGVEIERNVSGTVGAGYLASAAWVGHEGEGQNYAWPFTFSEIAEEYDRRYGLRDEHLRRIASQNIANAKTNPQAQTRGWLTPPECFSDDDDANPPVVGRVRRFDCSQVTDGGAGIVLVSDRWLRENQGAVRGPVARIAGWGHRSASLHLQDKLEASADADYVFPHVRDAISDAFSRAGIGDVFQVDGIETHDCFTISQYLAIDHFGITKPGCSGEAVDSGITRRDGELPINPSGGLIGGGHPIGATGVRMLLDGYLQVTGQATGYQVQGARRFATLNFGGSTATVVCTVIEG